MRIIWLVTLLVGIPCFAQHPYFYTLNDENGLPSNEVYTVVQDKAGFIWIGCEAGLFRYDGFTFRGYTHPRQNAKAISGLKFDQSGRLWCQNFAGQIYTVANDSLVIYADVQSRINQFPAFDVDSLQNLYIGLPEGILKISPDGQENILHQNEFFATEFKCIEPDSFFVYTKNRDFLLVGRNSIKSLDSLQSELRPDICWINKRDRNGYMLYANNRDKKFSLTGPGISGGMKSELLWQIPAGDMIYTSYQLDSSFWVTTSSGAYQLSPLNGQVIRHVFEGEKISNIFIDSENNYWFCSLENGIYVVPEMQLTILNKFNSQLADHNITSLIKVSADILWIGTQSGSIFAYHLKLGKITKLPEKSNLRYRTVTDLIRSDDQIIASRHNISLLDTNGSSERYMAASYFRDIELVGDTLYYASYEGCGFMLYNETYFENIFQNHVTLSKLSSRHVCYDYSQNKCWFTLSSGLFFCKNDSLYPFLDHGQSVYPTSLVWHDSVLWVGTSNQGVLGLRNDQVIYRINAENLLKRNAVTNISASKNQLVICTDKGVTLINHLTQKVDHLNVTDGINSNDINISLLDDEHLYLGSTKGLYIIPLKTIHPNSIKPQPRLVQVLVDGLPFNPDKPLIINHDDPLTISFDCASLRSRGQGYFIYRLNNLTIKWNHASAGVRELELLSLPPGEYDFELFAVNEDGYYSDEQVSLHFIVNAPFWQKWWFYLLIILFTLLGAIVIYTLRIRSIRRKHLMQERLVKSQLRTIKAQMNPHFIFNSLNSIQDLILQQDVRNSYHYLNKFSQLMRKVLEASESDEISLADEINFLTLYLDLEKLRFGEEFSYDIICDPSIHSSYRNLPSMLLQPFVENGIKHGLLHKKGAKKMTIEIVPIGSNAMRYIIRDNGVGRKKAAEINQRRQTNHNSFATRATEQRIELLNNRPGFSFNIVILDLIHSDEAVGTEVQITVTDQPRPD